MPRWILDRLAEPGERFNRAELMLREVPRTALWALLIALGLGVAWYVLAIAREPRAPRLRLIALRLLSGLLLALLVLGPSIELQRASRIPSRVAVLVDSSASLALGDGDGRRIDRARSAAARVRAALAGPFAVDLYRFDSALSPLGDGALGGLEPDGIGSDIAGALAALRGSGDEGALAGIVLITDGADTVRLGAPEDVARRLPEWPKVPIFPVLAGDPEQFRDLALVEPRFDRFGFVRHEIAIEARLVARGLPGHKAEVVLRQDSSPLETRRFEVVGGEMSIPVAFRIKPTRPGVYLYSLEVRAAAGESVTRNNRLEMAVTVGRDQVRLLMICGRPSWDERFLRQMLKQDPGVDLVSFFILRDNDDRPGVPQDELSLIPFPYNDLFTSELVNFDVVVLQNFSRTAFLSNLHLEHLREWVVEKGGGLLLVGGDLGMRAGGYAGTPVADILPFRLDFAGPDSDEGAFSPQVTREGLSHYVTNLEPQPEATRALFQSLPALDGVNRVGELQPGGLALLVHPRLTAGAAPMPVAAVREAGRGRTMGFTADSSWYWNFKAVAAGGSNREYLRFWQNSIRWLSHDPSAKYLSITSAREVYAPGEPAEIRVRALKSDYSALGGGRVRLVVRPAAAPRAPGVVREGLSDAGGWFQAEVPVGEEGIQRVEAELSDARGAVVDRAELLYEVRADRTEIESPGFGTALLDELARASGGRRLGLAELDRPPIEPQDRWRLAERRRVDLWDNGVVLAALLMTLTAEWWLRRRAGFP